MLGEHFTGPQTPCFGLQPPLLCCSHGSPQMTALDHVDGFNVLRVKNGNSARMCSKLVASALLAHQENDSSILDSKFHIALTEGASVRG